MKNKKALITGITGFAGSHLAELLLKKDYDVYGTTRPRSKTDNIDHIKRKLNLQRSVSRLVAQVNSA